MIIPYAASTANGSGSRITVPASASINNLISGSGLMVVQTVTLSPSTQRNLWGKSTGANRNVLFQSSGNLSFQFGQGTGGATCQATAAFTGWAGVTAGMPLVLAASWSLGGGTAPKLYAGKVGGVLSEPTSYSVQTAGTAGAPTHDDSGSSLDILAASGGGNVPDGDCWWLQWWNRQLTVEELQAAADRLDGRIWASVGAWAPGLSQGTTLQDYSGNGGVGTISGQVRPRPRSIASPHEPPRLARWKRALFAPASFLSAWARGSNAIYQPGVC